MYEIEKRGLSGRVLGMMVVAPRRGKVGNRGGMTRERDDNGEWGMVKEEREVGEERRKADRQRGGRRKEKRIGI